MSARNLRLPNLSHASLRPGLVWGTPKTIAYATTAQMTTLDGTAYVEIQHHGNRIALVHFERVIIDTCGWDSRTTSDRLDRILRDNGIRTRCGIRQHRTVLMDHDTLAVIASGLNAATFERGEIVSIDAEVGSR